MKRNNISAVILVVLVILCVAACGKTDPQCVFQMNDRQIKEPQFAYYIAANRTEIISRYQTEGESIDSRFWRKETEEGGTVEEALKQAAKEQCIYEQTILDLAEEEGLIEDASFEAMEKEMETENQSREEKQKNNQVVYGAKRYDMQTYMRYCLSNLTRELEKSREKEDLETVVEQRAKQAEVEINRSVWDEIKVE